MGYLHHVPTHSHSDSVLPFIAVENKTKQVAHVLPHGEPYIAYGMPHLITLLDAP